jgi:hypothetical protein
VSAIAYGRAGKQVESGNNLIGIDLFDTSYWYTDAMKGRAGHAELIVDLQPK